MATSSLHAEPAGGRLLTATEAAQVVGLSSKTLAQYRWRGGGPGYFIVGRYVRYDENELSAWMRSRRYTSTSQEAAG